MSIHLLRSGLIYTTPSGGGGGLPFAIIQSAEGTSTTAITTATFSSAPTPGNLIILSFSSDDYNGTPDAGWTQSTGMEQQTFHGGYLWHKIAADATNSFQYTIGSAVRSQWILTEVQGVAASSYVDVSNGQSAASSAGTYSTPSITPTVGDRIVFAQFGMSHSSAQDFSGDISGWTNSFTHIRSAGQNMGTPPIELVTLAYKTVTGDGTTTQSTTVNLTPAHESASGLIIAFKKS